MKQSFDAWISVDSFSRLSHVINNDFILDTRLEKTDVPVVTRLSLGPAIGLYDCLETSERRIGLENIKAHWASFGN
jgi:hypothetical protein